MLSRLPHLRISHIPQVSDHTVGDHAAPLVCRHQRVRRCCPTHCSSLLISLSTTPLQYKCGIWQPAGRQPAVHPSRRPLHYRPVQRGGKAVQQRYRWVRQTFGSCAAPRFSPHITLSAPLDSRFKRTTEPLPAHHLERRPMTAGSCAPPSPSPRTAGATRVGEQL